MPSNTGVWHGGAFSVRRLAVTCTCLFRMVDPAKSHPAAVDAG